MKLELKALLAAQYANYPYSELQDVYKAIFQACLGPEHLLHDLEAARGHLEREVAQLQPEPGILVEPLSASFVRLHLRAALYRGLSTESMFAAFAASAELPPDRGELERCLHAWPLLSDRPAEAGAYVQDMLARGCPAVHHSALYRRFYRPAYRVLHRKTLEALGTKALGTEPVA